MGRRRRRMSIVMVMRHDFAALKQKQIQLLEPVCNFSIDSIQDMNEHSSMYLPTLRFSSLN